MRAVLFGFAGVAPRSAMPNLIELLSTMITRFPAESKLWMTNILFAVSVSSYLHDHLLNYRPRMISIIVEQMQMRKTSSSKLCSGRLRTTVSLVLTNPNWPLGRVRSSAPARLHSSSPSSQED